jgi:uncharacterized caspase-like protein
LFGILPVAPTIPTDYYPRMKMIWRILAFLHVFLLVGGVLAHGETRHALVIGNGAYQHARELGNPRNDAAAIAAKLASLGFAVIQREDATLREMRAAVREFVQSVPKGGVALVYYAGHGVQIKGTNYLIPVDAQMSQEYEVQDETMSMDSLLRALDETQSALSIFVLDCCRDNPFSRSWHSSRSVASSGLVVPADMPSGMFLAYATSPGHTADDGGSGHSPYTEALLAELGQPGMDFEKVFKSVGARVAQASKGQQEPWYDSKFYGNFVFATGEGLGVQELPPSSPPPKPQPATPAPRKVQPGKGHGDDSEPSDNTKGNANARRKHAPVTPAPKGRATQPRDASPKSPKSPPQDDFLDRSKKLDDR